MLQKEAQNNMQATQYDTLWHFVFFIILIYSYSQVGDMAKPSTLYY